MLNAKLISKPNLMANLDKGITEIVKNKQSKNAVPTTEQQIIVADSGHELEKCIVEPIPEEYIIPSGVIEIEANGEYDVKQYERAVVKTDAIDKLQYKCDNIKSLAYEFYTPKSTPNIMTNEIITETMKGVNTSKVKNMSHMIECEQSSISQVSDLSGITIDASSCEDMSYMLRLNTKLVKPPKVINAKPLTIYSMCAECRGLENPIEMDTSEVQSFSGLYNQCNKLKTTYKYDMSSATSLSYIYYGCYELAEEIEITLVQPNVDLGSAFNRCYKVPKITIHNSRNGQKWNTAFVGCETITELYLDLLNATNVSGMLTNTNQMTNLYLKNIKLNLQIGTGSLYGHLLTDDSIVNTFSELHDMTGSTAKTLTLSTPSYARAEAIYVKLVDITDEMRAEDEYIDNKKPCVVCESTDVDAMTLKEYGISKNWNIARG